MERHWERCRDIEKDGEKERHIAGLTYFAEISSVNGKKGGGVENGWWGVPAIIYFVDKNKTHKKAPRTKKTSVALISPGAVTLISPGAATHACKFPLHPHENVVIKTDKTRRFEFEECCMSCHGDPLSSWIIVLSLVSLRVRLKV